jgi:spermidine/putrescine transport system permease protein
MEIATSRNGLRALRTFFVLLVVFLYAPIVVLVLFSFNDSVVISFPLSGFTLRWYEQFLSNPSLIRALRTSLTVATLSSAITVALGVLASVVIVRRRFVGKSAVSALLLSPLVIPYVVFGISLLVLFRMIDRVLAPTFGVVIGVGIHAIVIGHVVVSLPYAILTLVPRLERISVSLEEAARDLGAGTVETFRRVTLPLILPAIVSAFLIAFTLSFDEYAIASFVAGNEATYPIYLFSQLRVAFLFPQLLAVSSIVLVASLLLVLATEIGRRRAERKLEGQPGGIVL